jgi:hypothetical protein
LFQPLRSGVSNAAHNNSDQALAARREKQTPITVILNPLISMAEVTIIRGFGAVVLRFRLMVSLTDQTLSCTARARVPKPERHAARLHVRRANARRVTP